MKELINLLNRAAAALETPGDLTDSDRVHLIEDLVDTADELKEKSDVIEMALVFDAEGQVLFWKGPQGSTRGSIDDSQLLWDRIWRERSKVGGIAHTHPWMGEVWPSSTDLTTFAAIERGLGRKLVWPILTFTEVKYYVSDEVIDGELTFKTTKPQFADSKVWLDNMEELRRLSHNGG